MNKFLPIITLALIGGVGVFIWKNQTSAPIPTASATAAARHSLPKISRPPTSSHLAFLTDPSQPWQSRVDQFRNALATDCAEPEIRHLYQLLEQGPAPGELAEHWYVIANDIMIQLSKHDRDPHRFTSHLIGLLQNSQQPIVIRDYAVQFLANSLLPQADGPAKNFARPTPELTSQILGALITATTDSSLEQTSIPGTTLMMLVNLARSSGSGDSLTMDSAAVTTTLKPWLTRALQDGSSLSTAIRVSAIQAAAALAPVEFRPVLRQLAYQENRQSSLRLPAIAALGQCGEPADLSKLAAIMQNSPDLTYAAQDAHQALAARVNSASSLKSEN